MTYDPFATREKTPAISFKDAPLGTSYTGKIVEPPEMVNSRDFETGELATWPDGNPKKSVVTLLEMIGGPNNGEIRGLWAAKPSAMFAAIADAQEAAGAQLAVGGTITVTYTHDVPSSKNPRLNPAKQYKVVYYPNNPFAEDGQQINRTTGEVAQQGPQPEWSLPPAQQQPATLPPQQHPDPHYVSQQPLAQQPFAGVSANDVQTVQQQPAQQQDPTIIASLLAADPSGAMLKAWQERQQ